jgi:hypothetical protein
MIEVTEKAAAELKTLLEQEDKPELALRIFVAGVACSGIQYGLAFDDELKEDDVTMESNGIKLVMAKDIEQTVVRRAPLRSRALPHSQVLTEAMPIQIEDDAIAVGSNLSITCMLRRRQFVACQ